jgi:alpha-tubulin suppressor-like RCC1 family protein
MKPLLAPAARCSFSFRLALVLGVLEAMLSNCALPDQVALASSSDASEHAGKDAGTAVTEASPAEAEPEGGASRDDAQNLDVSTPSSDAGARDATLEPPSDESGDVGSEMLETTPEEAGDVGGAGSGCDVDASASPAVTAGSGHTCALSSTGLVRCWGFNNEGELGDGTSGNSKPTPITVPIASVRALSAGLYHTCALTASGGVRCWGDNSLGQVGMGADAGAVQSLPSPDDVLSNAKAIAAGGSTTCALTMGGGVRCWGSNDGGELGDGTQVNRASPPSTDVPIGEPVTAIVTGREHVCALTSSGGVRCWGMNLYGALGNGQPPELRLSPNRIDVLTGVQALAAGGYHTCALTKAGAVRCWGYNIYGQLGDGTTTDGHVPGPVVLTGARAITAGDNFTCALMTTGIVRCWGADVSGQLGDRMLSVDQTLPTAGLLLGSMAISLVAGESHACAVTIDGTLHCWGADGFGQLGDTSTADARLDPVAVSSIGTVCPLMTVGGP